MATANDSLPRQKWTNYTFVERFERKMRHLNKRANSPGALLTHQFSIPIIGVGIPLPIVLIIVFLSSVAVVFLVSKTKEDYHARRRVWLAEFTGELAPEVDTVDPGALATKTTTLNTVHQHVAKYYAPRLNQSINHRMRRNSNRTPSLMAAIPTTWSALVNRAPLPRNPEVVRKLTLPTPQDLAAERADYERALQKRQAHKRT